jgi:hypothetical protein
MKIATYLFAAVATLLALSMTAVLLYSYPVPRESLRDFRLSETEINGYPAITIDGRLLGGMVAVRNVELYRTGRRMTLVVRAGITRPRLRDARFHYCIQLPADVDAVSFGHPERVVWRRGWQAQKQKELEVPLDREVALAGELRQVYGYGPPGYGENKKVDEPITYWVLDLPIPVNTACTPEKPEWAAEDCESTKRLRLFFPTLPAGNRLELRATAMQGHSVLATGVLHRASTMGEITPIYMNEADIRLPHGRER